MKKSDFLKILETFPGKEELVRGVQPNRLKAMQQHDFMKIAEELEKAKLNLDLGKDEDLWIKFISFMDEIEKFLVEKESTMCLLEERLLSSNSQGISEEIANKFNIFWLERYSKSPNCLQASGIMLEGLKTFLKERKSFF